MPISNDSGLDIDQAALNIVLFGDSSLALNQAAARFNNEYVLISDQAALTMDSLLCHLCFGIDQAAASVCLVFTCVRCCLISGRHF